MDGLATAMLRDAMRELRRWCGRGGRAVVAVEFAITLPILLAFLGGVTDFGLVFYRQNCLAQALAAGAAYASVTYETGPSNLTAANIKTVMKNAAAQSMPGVSVTANAQNLGTCYCISGTSPNSTITAAASCGTSCPSGGNSENYVYLTLSTTYKAILPLYSLLGGSTTLTESAWVPLVNTSSS